MYLSLLSMRLRGTSVLNPRRLIVSSVIRSSFPYLPRTDKPKRAFPERRTRQAAPVRRRSSRRDIGNKYRYITWAIQACVYVHVCARVTRIHEYELTLWCCMMAVAFRLADIFSSPGCLLSAPLRGAGNICLAGLYPTVRLCPPVSSCLSVLRSSVCFSLLLASHKRPPEGTATITRNTKAGGERRGG